MMDKSRMQQDAQQLTPRSHYAHKREVAEKRLVEIMKHLNHKRMASIHKVFRDNGDSVNIYQFVTLMKEHLPEFRPSSTERGTDASGNLGLVANLCELFWEIDINGDETLEWDEFVMFIAETANVHGSKQHVTDTTYYHPIHKLEGPAKRNALNNYIDRVQYIPNLDSLLVTEQHSSVVKLYDAADCSELGRMYHNSKILTATYAHTMAFNASGGVQFRNENADGAGAVFASSANHTLAVWDLTPGSRQYSLRATWPTPHAQSALCWTSRFNTLFSGSTAGIIHSWDVATRKEKSAIMGHDDIVTVAMTIPDIDCLATGSMDKTIRIWDVHTGARRQCLRGHRRGILALAYSQEQRLLVSAGHDHEAHVWSPFTPTLLFKLKGHATSLISVQEIPETLQVVTGDAEGILKVWDLRTCKCMQTISDDAPIHNITSMTVCKGEKPKIVCSTRHLHFFDQSDPFADFVSHDIPVIVALFNTVSMTILTAAGRTVKIWNALTGRVCRIYHDIASSDITTVCLDDRQRKFIVGDHAGQIKVYDYSNGAMMKTMDPHKSEVTCLAYYDQDKTIISSSWDRSIVVHDELNPDRGDRLREMDPLNAHRDDVTAVDVSFALSLVATASQDKTVRLWDYETGKMDSCLTHSSAIICLRFLSPYPILAVAEASGKIRLWGVRLSKFKDQTIMAWDHFRKGLEVDQSLSGQRRSTMGYLPKSMAVSMLWDITTMRIYTGDDFGYLRAYGLNNILARIKEGAVSLPTATTTHRRASMVPKVQAEARPEIDSELLCAVWSLQAHEDTISSLQVLIEHKLILTASIDCRVKVFSSVDGEHMGTLVQNLSTRTMRSPHWNVPYDVDALEVRDMAFAKEVVKKQSAEKASKLNMTNNLQKNNQLVATDVADELLNRNSTDTRKTITKGGNHQDNGSSAGMTKSFQQTTPTDARPRVPPIGSKSIVALPAGIGPLGHTPSSLLPPVCLTGGVGGGMGLTIVAPSESGAQRIEQRNGRSSPSARELVKAAKSQTRKNALNEMMQVPV